MTAGQDAHEPVDWPAVAAPIAAVARWRPAPGAAAEETSWARPGFTRPGPEPEHEPEAGA